MVSGEIARNEQFLLFPQWFLLNQITEYPFVHSFDVTSFAAQLEDPKVGIGGKGLIIYRHHLYILQIECFRGGILESTLPV